MDTPVANPALAGRRALVTDDSETARMILTRILERAGMQVTTAGNGTEAVLRLGAAPGGFDIILMDLVMEEPDGIETMNCMRPILTGHACKMIAMSASVTPEIAARCVAAGAEAEILAKPFRAASVLAAVTRALGASRPAPSPPKPAKPGSDPDFADFERMQLAAFPECDLAGAIERCGGDVGMLHHLLADIGTKGCGQMNAARDALRRSDVSTALKRLHNLRGDLGNLGMTELEAAVLGLENRLRGTGDPAHGSTDSARSHEFLRRMEAADAQLVGIGLHLVGTVANLRKLPAFQGLPAPTVAADAETAGDEHLSALVGAMQINDAAALPMAQRIGRRLPPRYAREVDAAFWQCFDSLDFPGAIVLLDAEDRKHAPADAQLDGVRILVVDDAPLVLKLLCNLLEGMGHIRFALSGEEALAMTRNWMPSLVISDITMGAMSGIDLCRRLQQEPRTADTPVILISADNDVGCEVQALTAGAADFLDKPLNPARVIGRVSAQLAQAARMTEVASSFAGESRTAQAGFMTCSFSGAILEINPALSALLKHPPGQPARRMLSDCLDAESAARWETARGILASTGRTLPFDVVAIAADGSMLPLRLLCRAAPGIHGRIVWVGVDDLRDRFLAERRRLDEEVSRAVATLTGGIAHEFNNLLNIAIGNLDLVLEGDHHNLEERVRRASDAILRTAEISRRLTESAQRAARPSGLQAQDLEAMIEASWPVIRNTVPRNIQVVREFSGVALPVALEPEGLRTSLAAILQNAWEAMPASGAIVIRTRPEDRAGTDDDRGAQFVVLEIADTGSGMAQETRERAFDPFFTTRGPRHRGLGLTQVQGYASRNGGSAELSSDIGQGSLVRLRFPRAGATAGHGP